nr:MAG TPA: hypothetical protein [Bacteriophage sp.]
MFSFVKSATNPNFPIIKQLPTTASTTYKIGDALILNDGVLAAATGTTKPQYICAENYEAPESGMKEISVYEIVDGQEWETTFAADASAVKAGSKVTIHTDGAQVTATTASGVFTLLSDGGAVGSKVVGKF